LHKTPGDQEKDAAISNYDESKPSLWEQMQINIVFKQGKHKIRVHFEGGNFNLNFWSLKKTAKSK
jgi:hypothetical protein